ncbi:mitochondrial protein Pet127-domain-containing protein [Boletus edulis BED1]|uniref:Mitochondrial protein Pet127-domain-containing protein n=1 Tax=Boletus edulis BED1 TaxID=1328754 RepID=A0AAD4BIF6_BOLED|nr:mitochondrial protein Pet127-domain-containing protein [Boletus edulis BED1]
MQRLTWPRLALIVAGRRVVQPFHARTLRILLPSRAELIPHPPTPPLAAHHSDAILPESKKVKKKKSSSTKPKGKKPASVTHKKSKSTQIVARDSQLKRQKNMRKTKGVSAEEQARNGSGFTSDDWGKDELAPPTKGRSASKLRPRKEIVPVPSKSSSSSRALPPHHIPYVRRTEGYISDDTEQCNSVLRDVESPSEHRPIAQLAHGLDRVLFNPGVYWLRDPRSRIYNFTPWLESIPAVTDFAFERVTGFVKSSMDNDLWKVAKQYKRPFAGSTSSLTGLLSHCYFLISGDKEVDTSSLSRAFLHQPTNFTPGQRMPTSVVLNYKEGVWLVDSDKTQELAEKNVLTWMGTMLEKFLTVSEGEFKKLLRSASMVEEESDTRREAYRYAMSDRFVMRSQLDCVDPRLPGTGVFDIKTRAAVPIRLDILNYEENSGYLIKTLTGPLESIEKEYYDLIRSAFLKYSFQARIGNMDGVLVAYHNTARIFGFQYVSLEEMEERLYGSGNGTRVFNKCVSLLERILSDVVSVYGERSVKCTFETRELSQELNVWIQPVEWDEQVEGKPCPITEIDVGVVSYLDGEEVNGATAVSDGRGWVLQWTLTESALDEAEIRRRLDGACDRQFRALNFPAGIKTVEEMEKIWAKIDFGGKQVTQEMIAAMKELGSHSKNDTASDERPVSGKNGLASEQQLRTQNKSSAAHTSSPDEAPQETPSLPSPSSDSPSSSQSPRPSSYLSSFLSFREPSKNIKQLRLLALQGRQETLREEAEGREKVVWGSVDELPDAEVQQAEGGDDRDGDGDGDQDCPGPVLGDGTLPGVKEREVSEVGRVMVGGESPVLE